MAAALVISAGTAYYTSITPSLLQSIYSSGTIFALVIGQLALVLFLSFMLEKMNVVTAVMAFLLYSVLTGLTLSSVFLVFTQASIISTFIVTAGMFGIMALYGYLTNEDLSSMRNILMMALIGLILGGLVNMFLKSPGFNYILSGIGVVVFAMLTAYDMQKIKRFSQSMLAHGEMGNKIAIISSLMLYLDFINMFLYLLQIFGQRRNN